MEGYLAPIITSDSHIYIQCGLSVNANHQQSCRVRVSVHAGGGAGQNASSVDCARVVRGIAVYTMVDAWLEHHIAGQSLVARANMVESTTMSLEPYMGIWLSGS